MANLFWYLNMLRTCLRSFVFDFFFVLFSIREQHLSLYLLNKRYYAFSTCLPADILFITPDIPVWRYVILVKKGSQSLEGNKTLCGTRRLLPKSFTFSFICFIWFWNLTSLKHWIVFTLNWLQQQKCLHISATCIKTKNK